MRKILLLGSKEILLHVPIREPTDEELQQFPIFDIISNDLWDPQALDDEDPVSGGIQRIITVSLSWMK